jgi:hypothetical protein
MMRKLILVVALLTLAAATLVTSARSKPALRDETPSIELGEHLVTILSCNDCHTPFKLGPNGPEPDMNRMLSGHPQELVMPQPPVLGEGPWAWVGAVTNTAFAGPWGVTYSPNLTPHENGMGIWTEQMFVDAIRTGRHMGQSRRIQPPMPWPYLSRMTDHELRSVYAYLRTIPPVDNLVPDYREPGGEHDEGDSW